VKKTEGDQEGQGYKPMVRQADGVEVLADQRRMDLVIGPGQGQPQAQGEQDRIQRPEIIHRPV
jgi:hypothetical protein